MNATLLGESIVAATKDQVSCDLGGEAAILHIRKGRYYGLDPVGARVWDLLQQPRSVREIQGTLLKEFEVEPERCEADLLALLQKLLDEELIEVREPPGA